ncbi:MAG TPA: hemerythrin domain-containing protein, partial [Acidobacteriota bacterium]|nr:hemerythrin domain-containing protein [Acidobacteriota bacterium]
MSGTIYEYLADDHRRLDDLLYRICADSTTVEGAAYGLFRTGSLKHIAMEEKIILPAAQKRRGGEP